MAAVPQPLSLLPPSFTTKIKSPPQESIHRWEGQYQRVKNAEIDILQGSGPHTSDNLVAITILGCCMLETESLSGLLKLSDKIQAASDSSDGDEKLIELGKFYLRHLLKLFFRAQRSTPAPSKPEPDYPDEPQCHAEDLSYIGVKHLAWTRDQRRCVVTGSYDDFDSSRQALEYHSRTHQFAYKLRTAYIIPESFSNILEGSSDDLEALYMVLETFGFEDIIEDLRGPNIHRVCNILTLAEHVYTKFDWLALWFEETDRESEYNLRVLRDNFRPNAPVTGLWNMSWNRYQHVEKVVFKGTSSLPPPCPRYLALHALCCRIGEISGATWLLQELHEESAAVTEKGTMEMSRDDLRTLSRAMDMGFVVYRSRDSN